MWTFIKYDVKQRLRDRATLFWMLLFPLILIFGLGTMLSAVFSDTFKLPVTNVAYVEASTDQYREPRENFLNDEDIISLLWLPDSLKLVGRFLPTYWLNNGVTTMYEGQFPFLSILVMIGMTAVVFLLTVLVLKKRPLTV